jgi:predicted small integral membrane protein
VTLVQSLILFKLLLVAGLALWLTVIVLNNVIAFGNGVAALGILMGMQLFDQAPAIDTPLRARSVTARVWHRIVFGFVVLLEVVVALLLWYAAIGFAGALLGGSDPVAAITRGNLALAAFAALAFVMMLGGSWFAYYIRQETVQITHFVLIVVAISGAILMNLPVG